MSPRWSRRPRRTHCGGHFLGPERAADVLDAAELELLVAVRLLAPRSRATAGGGVLSAPRDGTPRGRSGARARVGAPAAAARRPPQARPSGAASGWPSLRAAAAALALGRRRRSAPTTQLVASRRTGVSGCATA